MENYEQILKNRYLNTVMKQEGTEEEVQWEERMKSESRARVAALQSPLQSRNQDFRSRVEADWPPLLASWTAEGSPVQQQPSHKETIKEGRERKRREKEMKRDGCTEQAEYTYEVHRAMEQETPQDSFARPESSEEEKRQYVESLVTSLKQELEIDCIEERNMAKDMHKIQEKEAQYDALQRLMDSGSPYLEGIDPAVLEGIARRKEVFLQTAALAAAFREAQGVGKNGKYTNNKAAMERKRKEYEKKRGEVDHALGEHIFKEYTDYTEALISNNQYKIAADVFSGRKWMHLRGGMWYNMST